MAKPHSGTLPPGTPPPSGSAPSEPQVAPSKDAPDDAPYWGCPIHNHWGSRDKSLAIDRDGTLYCPDHPGTKLIRAG